MSNGFITLVTARESELSEENKKLRNIINKLTKENVRLQEELEDLNKDYCELVKITQDCLELSNSILDSNSQMNSGCYNADPEDYEDRWFDPSGKSHYKAKKAHRMEFDDRKTVRAGNTEASLSKRGFRIRVKF